MAKPNSQANHGNGNRAASESAKSQREAESRAEDELNQDADGAASEEDWGFETERSRFSKETVIGLTLIIALLGVFGYVAYQKLYPQQTVAAQESDTDGGDAQATAESDTDQASVTDVAGDQATGSDQFASSTESDATSQSDNNSSFSWNDSSETNATESATTSSSNSSFAPWEEQTEPEPSGSRDVAQSRQSSTNQSSSDSGYSDNQYADASSNHGSSNSSRYGADTSSGYGTSDASGYGVDDSTSYGSGNSTGYGADDASGDRGSAAMEQGSANGYSSSGYASDSTSSWADFGGRDQGESTNAMAKPSSTSDHTTGYGGSNVDSSTSSDPSAFESDGNDNSNYGSDYSGMGQNHTSDAYNDSSSESSDPFGFSDASSAAESQFGDDVDMNSASSGWNSDSSSGLGESVSSTSDRSAGNDDTLPWATDQQDQAGSQRFGSYQPVEVESVQAGSQTMVSPTNSGMVTNNNDSFSTGSNDNYGAGFQNRSNSMNQTFRDSQQDAFTQNTETSGDLSATGESSRMPWETGGVTDRNANSGSSSGTDRDSQSADVSDWNGLSMTNRVDAKSSASNKRNSKNHGKNRKNEAAGYASHTKNDQNQGWSFDSATNPQPTQTHDGTYVIQSGDNYWKISKTVYGTSRYFQALALHNKKSIPDPKRMRPGTRIATPDAGQLEARYASLLPARSAPMPAQVAASPTETSSRQPSEPTGFFMSNSGAPMYRVGAHDTLSQISQDHLGRSTRWIQIFEMNRNQLKNPDSLKLGMELRLPSDASRKRLASRPWNAR